jgi:prolyl oligopeptidase
VVEDPYRWLEDPDDAVVKDWVNRQVEFTSNYVREELESRKKKVVKEMTSLWNYEKFGTPFERGGRYFFHHNTGTQNQYIMYTCDSLDDLKKKKKRVLLDVNSMRKDGTAAMKTYSVSEDGNYLAYAISYGGSDWSTIFLRDVKTAKDMDNVKIEWVKFSSISWTPDGRGFFYSRYPALDENLDQGT